MQFQRRQFQKIDDIWMERVVSLVDGDLAFGIRPADVEMLSEFPPCGDGTIFEHSPQRNNIAEHLGARIREFGGAGLIIDYGDRDGVGDTLQAVKNHEFVNVLSTAGEADVTTHVRFADLIATANVPWAKLTTQGEFLERIGITARANQLAKTATETEAAEIVRAHRRLTHPEEMGSLFKVLGLGSDARRHLCRGSDHGHHKPFAHHCLKASHTAFSLVKAAMSSGIYAGLNCGPGSADDPAAVEANRRHGCNRKLVWKINAFCQRISAIPAICIPVAAPFDGERPKCDAMVATNASLALGILTADCAPVLMADPVANVVGAAHAGWHGALGGVVEQTLEMMTKHGAQLGRINLVIGPQSASAPMRSGRSTSSGSPTRTDSSPGFS